MSAKKYQIMVFGVTTFLEIVDLAEEISGAVKNTEWLTVWWIYLCKGIDWV